MTAEKRIRVNQHIKAMQVRLIDIEGNQVGVVSRDDALEQASASGADLVEISPNAEPPVCRIMDYGKFRFEQNKKAAIAKKNQKVFQIKEMKFRPTTDEGDYQVKLRKLLGFLSDGNKAKVTIRFRGREMAHQELGMALVQRIKGNLEEYSVVEQEPKLEGRQIVMVLAPKK